MTTYDSAELKRRFVNTTDFADFHKYYLSNFVERGPFLKLGRALSTPRASFLIRAFVQAYNSVWGTRLAEISSQLIEVPELGLIHGALVAEGKLASVLYFDDLQMGMFAVVDNALTGDMKYMRFHASRRDSVFLDS